MHSIKIITINYTEIRGRKQETNELGMSKLGRANQTKERNQKGKSGEIRDVAKSDRNQGRTPQLHNSQLIINN